jgi:hypothetical protein
MMETRPRTTESAAFDASAALATLIVGTLPIAIPSANAPAGA